jgi:hypothetical protein
VKNLDNGKDYSMQIADKYTSETKTIPFNGGTMTIVNLTPILTPKEREKRKREIEQRLFDVFSKYRTRTASPQN